MKITFGGSSDDNVCFSIDGEHDEWGCYQSSDDMHHATAMVATVGGAQGVLVHALYDGTWSFAVGMLGESRSPPSWAFAIEKEHDYSTRLVIDTGDDLVEVTRVEQKRGEWTPVRED